MKIHTLSFSELKKSLEKQTLLLDLDFKSKNDLFRTQKIFSTQSNLVTKKNPSKQRILSVTPRGGQHSKQKNENAMKNNRPRPSTSNLSRKTHINTFDYEQSHLRPRTATNRFWKGIQVTRVTKQDIFLELSKQIKRYFATIITEEEKSETLDELKLLLNILQKEKDTSLVFVQLQKLQYHLSRFLKHRICHLYFYLVYYKFYMCYSKEPLQNQLKLLTLAEYHARTFYFRKVAMLICIEIQQKLVKMNYYAQSRNYAVKSLKLAILINDRYQETKMLEYIGVLKYYEGVLNTNGTNLLTEQQRINILKLYNQEDQIPKIFDFLEKNPKKLTKAEYNKENVSIEDEAISSFEKDRIHLNQGQNFIKSNVPNTNLKRFNRNFHEIGKKLTKNNSVKQTIKKVCEVGQVKKFFGKDNYITLHPQGYTINNKFQSQVFVTHKKYADIGRSSNFVNKQLPSIIMNLDTLISTEISQKKYNLIKRRHENNQIEKNSD